MAPKLTWSRLMCWSSHKGPDLPDQLMHCCCVVAQNQWDLNCFRQPKLHLEMISRCISLCITQESPPTLNWVKSLWKLTRGKWPLMFKVLSSFPKSFSPIFQSTPAAASSCFLVFQPARELCAGPLQYPSMHLTAHFSFTAISDRLRSYQDSSRADG